MTRHLASYCAGLFPDILSCGRRGRLGVEGWGPWPVFWHRTYHLPLHWVTSIVTFLVADDYLALQVDSSPEEETTFAIVVGLGGKISVARPQKKYGIGSRALPVQRLRFQGCLVEAAAESHECFSHSPPWQALGSPYDSQCCSPEFLKETRQTC